MKINNYHNKILIIFIISKLKVEEKVVAARNVGCKQN